MLSRSQSTVCLLVLLPLAVQSVLLTHGTRRSRSRPSRVMMAQWNFPRFVQTAAFFNGPVEVLRRLAPTKPSPPRRDGLIWSADQPSLLEWGPLDDVVMGGVSQSTFAVERGCGVFSGTISTENNGGFAGCRSRAIVPALRLSDFSGVRLSVRGDGKRYKLIVRDDYSWNGIAWMYCFTTADGGEDEWQEVEAPFADFIPTLFARRVPGAVLKTDSITAVQLTLSKFELDTELNPRFGTGPFQLELRSVVAYKAGV